MSQERRLTIDETILPDVGGQYRNTLTREIRTLLRYSKDSDVLRSVRDDGEWIRTELSADIFWMKYIHASARMD